MISLSFGCNSIKIAVDQKTGIVAAFCSWPKNTAYKERVMNRIVATFLASFFLTTVYVNGSDLVTFNRAALYDKSQPTMKVLNKG